MGIVLCISIVFILIFSRFAISKPLRFLTASAEEIKLGNFNTPLISMLNTKRRDEIGILNKSTQDEQDFLNTFARFTNRGVAKAIARKEIDFEPHLKDVSIFFSDIRGFTAISDGFKNRFGEESPREIIGFLNDYMSRMVNCVTISGGTIDKFEGDAIMAVWGILRDEDLSFEQLPDGNPEKQKKPKNTESMFSRMQSTQSAEQLQCATLSCSTTRMQKPLQKHTNMKLRQNINRTLESAAELIPDGQPAVLWAVKIKWNTRQSETV